MKNNLRPFHLAFPAFDLEETKRWYVNVLDCKIGRESSSWVDFDFFGHQISAHLTDEKNRKLATNNVDQKQIPFAFEFLYQNISITDFLTPPHSKYS